MAQMDYDSLSCAHAKKEAPNAGSSRIYASTGWPSALTAATPRSCIAITNT